MGLGAGLHMYNVVVKSSRSLSHLVMSFLSFIHDQCTTGIQALYSYEYSTEH